MPGGSTTLTLPGGPYFALTFANDQFTQHKWAQVGVTTQSLAALQVSDFEVVELGYRSSSTPRMALDAPANGTSAGASFRSAEVDLHCPPVAPVTVRT